MPELPEVETTVRDLQPLATGQKIVNLWTDPKKPIKTGDGSSWKEIAKLAKDRKIQSVRRHAKYIVLDLSSSESLYIHQKMAGHLRFGQFKPGDRHIRLIISLSNGQKIALSDPRRFGTLTLVSPERKAAWQKIQSFGPEPLPMTKKQFQDLFMGKRGVIKSVLMNPTWISGIGNIYADEMLWLSGVHPLSRVERLKTKQIDSLFSSMKAVLAKAIKYRGSSVENYRAVNGQSGSFQNHHRVYQKTGLACLKKDGGTIERIRIGARSSHFCPKHQLLIK